MLITISLKITDAWLKILFKILLKIPLIKGLKDIVLLKE